MRTKMAAHKIVLDFTKAKPGNAEWRAITAEGAEGWLRAVLGSGASLLTDAPMASLEGQP
jgi:hypothetical protein